MSDIKFSKDEKQQLIARIRDYFATELNQELGQFDAEFLLDFLSKELVQAFTIADCTMRRR